MWTNPLPERGHNFMTLTPAHWIAPNGECIGVKTSHIAAIIRDPSRFGVTDAWVRGQYAEHGEASRFGSEGQAREAIIRTVVTAGWIRTRRYIRPATYWSVTLGILDQATWMRLGDWVAAGLANHWLKPATELRLYTVCNDEMTCCEVAELLRRS
jgi:hypothetical protein